MRGKATSKSINTLDKKFWVICCFLSIILFLAQLNLGFVIRSPETEWASSLRPRGWSLVPDPHKRIGINYDSRRVALIALSVFSVLLLMSGKNRGFRINGILGWSTIIFVSWASFSLLWSTDFKLTARRIIVLWIIWLSAIAISQRFTLRQLISFAFFYSFLIVFTGLAIEICRGEFRPFYPPSQYWLIGGMNPGTMAQCSAILMLSSIALMKNVLLRKRTKWILIGLAALSIFLLFLSRSRSIFGASIMAFFLLLSITSKKRGRLVFCLWILILAGMAWIMLQPENIVSKSHQAYLMGRSPSTTRTLSSRIPLWGVCLEVFSSRPHIGYGYGVFAGNSQLWRLIGDYHPHNAYLEALLEMGIFGVAFTIMIISGVISAILRFRRFRNPNEALALAVILIYILMAGIINMYYSVGIIVFLTHILLARLAFGKEPPSRAWRPV